MKKGVSPALKLVTITLIVFAILGGLLVRKWQRDAVAEQQWTVPASQAYQMPE